jgi:transcriptional regulator with XRE-family HTH domain
VADWRDTFPGWLGARMRERGLRHLADLEYLAGIADATASDWRRGLNRPSRESCARLAEALGVPVDEVLAAAGYAG